MILQSGSSGFESQEYTQYGNLKKIVYPGFKTWIKGSWEVFFINRIWMEWNNKSKFLKSVMVKRVMMMNNERGMYFPFYDIFVTTAQINDWSTVFLTRSLNSSWKWYEWKIRKFCHVCSSSFPVFTSFFHVGVSSPWERALITCSSSCLTVTRSELPSVVAERQLMPFVSIGDGSNLKRSEALISWFDPGEFPTCSAVGPSGKGTGRCMVTVICECQ